jgi:coatomer subunit beta
VAAVTATTLSKLSLRLATICKDASIVNAFKTQSMLILTSIIRAGKSTKVASQIDEDSYARILLCIRVLSTSPQEKAITQSFLVDSRESFGKIITIRDVIFS